MKNSIPIFLATLFIMLGLVLAACGAASPTQEMYVDSGEGYYASAPEAARDMNLGMDTAAFDEEFITISNDQSQQAEERLVIKNADLVIVVKDPSSSMDAIVRLAEELGGFVVSANLYQTTAEGGAKVPQGSVTIRVPAEYLNDALDEIKGESDQDPLSESISSQDVTGEYVDLQSRLSNLEATETQLLVIMEDADETEDVLTVYNELVRVRGEIEVTKGRIKYLEQSAALSSVHVELLADEAVQPLTVGGWQPSGVAKTAVQALINALKFFANAAIWVVIFVLPVLLILFVVVFLPVRWVVRRLRRNKNEKTSDDEDADQQARQMDSEE